MGDVRSVPLEERLYPKSDSLTNEERAYKAIQRAIREICEGHYSAYLSNCYRRKRKPKSQFYRQDPIVEVLLRLDNDLRAGAIDAETVFATISTPYMLVERGKEKRSRNL